MNILELEKLIALDRNKEAFEMAQELLHDIKELVENISDLGIYLGQDTDKGFLYHKNMDAIEELLES